MKMLKIIITTISTVSLCLLLFVLNYTTPVANGPFGILAVFIFLYLFFVGFLAHVIFFISYIYNLLSVIFIYRKPVERFSFKRASFYSGVIAFAPIIVIALKSVGSIGFYELLLTIIFVLIGCLYVTKKTS